MTISYPLALPDTRGFRGLSLRPVAQVAHSRSPFTGEGQFYAHQGQIWAAQFDLPPMRRADAEPWVAFLLSLNGMQGTFLAGIAGSDVPRGIATGAPVVNGASQTGQVLLTDGWTPSQTGILKAGDLIQLGTGADTHLHKVLADANSDGAGAATLDIWPRLRVSPMDNAAIVVAGCKGLWRLASNEMPIEFSQPVIYSLSFGALEAI